MTFFNSPTSLKIITINAKALFTFCPKRSDEQDKLYRFDITRKQLVTSVVKQVEMMDTCPLFDQLLMVREENGESIYEIDDLGQNIALYRHLVMMDFDQIFLSGMGKRGVKGWKDAGSSQRSDRAWICYTFSGSGCASGGF